MTQPTDSPFFAGGMITDPEKFIGRRDALDQIMTRLRTEGQGTSVIGDRRIGKSSLLHYLYQPREDETLRPPAEMMVIYLSADDGRIQTPSTFLGLLVSQLLAKAIINRKTKAGRALFAFKTAVEERGHCSWTEAKEALAQLSHHPLICLDEMEAFFDKGFEPSFFNGLREWANSGLVTWITASKKPLFELGDSHGQSSPFFNLLVTVQLEPFQTAETDALFDLAGEQFTPRMRRKLVKLAGNNPYLLQLAAAELWRMQHSSTVSWHKLRDYLCNQSVKPTYCQKQFRPSHIQIAWTFILVLLIALVLLVYHSAPDRFSQFVKTIWAGLSSFGDGAGGLLLLMLLVATILGGIWKRKSIGEILGELWEQIT